MRFDGLTVLVLQQVGKRALESSRRSSGEGGGAPPRLHAVTGRLESDEPDARIVDERVEDSDRVGSSTDTGGYGIRQPAGLIEHLRPRLEADHPLKVAHHRREGMWSRCRAEAV